MARTLLALAALAAAVTAAGPLAADPNADPKEGGEALEMAADKLDLDVGARSAVLTGHVKLTRGALSVTCPRVEVRYDQVPHVTWLRGSGGVAAELKGIKAEAPEVELDLASQTLELRGGVRVTQGEGWITAEKASIQIASSRVSMTEVKGSLPVGKALPPRPAPPP